MEQSFGQNLRERFLSRDSKTAAKSSKINTAAVIGEMLGFVGRVAVETVTEDIHQMLKKKMRVEADGYIFALSRIMEHELAWECITKAFGDAGESVPVKYYAQFGKDVDKPAKPQSRMVAQ